MPTDLQEWIAIAIVALTSGFIIGRWLNKRRHKTKAADCGDCPQAKPSPTAFKNIPINVSHSDSKPKT